MITESYFIGSLIVFGAFCGAVGFMLGYALKKSDNYEDEVYSGRIRPTVRECKEK